MKEFKPLTVPLLAVQHYGPEHQKKKAIEEMGHHRETDVAFAMALQAQTIHGNRQ